MATLELTAEKAIERSQEHDEIVTIWGSPEVHATLRNECDDSVEAQPNGDGTEVTEYWGTYEGEADWRVHVRDQIAD